MTAYAIAHLHDPRPHPEVVEYLERIQATLVPYRGRFLIHGAAPEVREGSWPGTIVVIEFPGMDEGRAWYESPAYQEILSLRTDNINGDTFLIEGVQPGHDPAKLAAIMRRALQGAAVTR
jgi:uncharacterized protein (DUF1330 family)